jgi:hypothetical protein
MGEPAKKVGSKKRKRQQQIDSGTGQGQTRNGKKNKKKKQINETIPKDIGHSHKLAGQARA